MINRRTLLSGLAVSLLASAPAAGGGDAIELLGEAVIARALAGSEAPVGGLSGLSYDSGQDLYLAVSDDRSRFGAARVYAIEIDLDTAAARLDSVTIRRSIVLRRSDGSSFPPDSIDAEALALGPAGGWIVASEGGANIGLEAGLFEFDAEGAWLSELRLPRYFRPRDGAGIRHNLALEAAAISPDGRRLFSATENALIQDGAAASGVAGSASRLLQIDLATRRIEAIYVYRTAAVAEPPTGGEFAVNGLVELLALGDGRLLALERSYTAGRGNTVRLFLVDLEGATDIRRVRRLAGRKGVVPATKRLLVDLADLGVEPDNIEGMAFGPDLDDGRRTLVLVADDNFNPAAQRNQLLVLTVEPRLLAPEDPGP